MRSLTLTATLLMVALSAQARIEFIENDYARAMATAKAQNLPIFVETWAPW